jgi:hypothetical protein
MLFKELSPLFCLYHSEYKNRRRGQMQSFLVKMFRGQDKCQQRVVVSTVMNVRVS